MRGKLGKIRYAAVQVLAKMDGWGWAVPQSPGISLTANALLKALHVQGKQHRKIWGDLINSKYMVFKVKKLLNNNVDLRPWQKGGKKLCKRNKGRFCGFRPAFCPEDVS